MSRKEHSLLSCTETGIAPEDELKILLADFQDYLEGFELRFSKLVARIPCLDATGINFNLVLRTYQNVMVLMESSVKLKRFVENRLSS